jgi:hypothetical protein
VARTAVELHLLISCGQLFGKTVALETTPRRTLDSHQIFSDDNLALEILCGRCPPSIVAYAVNAGGAPEDELPQPTLV